MTMRWYAVHTLSGSEDKAMKALLQRIEQHDLQSRFGRVLVPTEVVVDPKTKRKVTRRFYPGYMLVEMDLDPETWNLVKNTPKVTGFVGNTKNPPPVPDSDVARITSMLSEEEEPRPVMDFEVGEEVRLTEGHYASMRGTVEEVNEARGKLRVVVNMFGRPVPTELSFHQVEKLS
ncbi:MAG: transcription termination/antitermination protein NusG [Myxococcota bacterium]